MATVVIPTRDRVRYLSHAIGSVLASRTDHAFEVLVVDNASTDETPALLADLSRREPRLSTIVESRLGRSQAMNAGISAARGEILAFTDDDVEVAPGWLDALVSFLRGRTDASILAGGPILPVAEDLGPWPDWLGAGSIGDIPVLSWGERERPLGRYEHLWGANMAAHRAVFEVHGAWDESIGRRGDERGTFEDVELQERLRAAGGDVWYLPDAWIRHRVPRPAVTPRSIVSNAFARGRNQVATGVVATPAEPAWPAMWSWALRAAALRGRRTENTVEAARDAAWRAGTRFDAGEGGRLRWWASRAILRLVPSSHEGRAR
jgi:glycosyltransferase involved in cell wall biosynthesis